MSKKDKTVQRYFNLFTKDFESDPSPIHNWKELGNGIRSLQEYQLELPSHLSIHDPYIVFLIFVNLKRFKFSGQWEKIAWEIPIKYKGIPFVLSHRKFGFRIISNKKDSETQTKAIEAIANIHKAIPYAESLMIPQIQEKVRNGNITLDNRYHEIYRRYDFFRKLSKAEFHSSKKGRLSLKGSRTKVLNAYKKYEQQRNAGNYYFGAMLDSYFSLLEHLMVLLLPFAREIDMTSIDLESFIGLSWKEKYKILFKPGSNLKASQILDKLDRIKEHIRNPLTHGYFEKGGNSFYVHIPNLSAIPLQMTKASKAVTYSFHQPAQLTFREVTKCFDEFEKFLATDPISKFGMLYIKENLSIAFDEESCERYQVSMRSTAAFKRFIEYMRREHADAINMDW